MRATVLALCVSALVGCRSAHTAPLVEPGAPSDAFGPLPPADAGRAAAVPAAPTAPAPPAKVQVYVRASPRAHVSWGKRSLGVTPLSLERPRESGPMDLVLRAKGYLPLHARAYTFRNDNLVVDMVPIDQKDSLLGAKKALLPAPAPGVPDGGAP